VFEGVVMWLRAAEAIVKGKGGVVNGWQEHGQVVEGKGAW